ncbi:9742_t:CDS:2 [Entrophospora sp. SA101]|nr:9742_t:CDS:2 [Entrophospora sp. SA101]
MTREKVRKKASNGRSLDYTKYSLSYTHFFAPQHQTQYSSQALVSRPSLNIVYTNGNAPRIPKDIFNKIIYKMEHTRDPTTNTQG